MRKPDSLTLREKQIMTVRLLYLAENDYWCRVALDSMIRTHEEELKGIKFPEPKIEENY